ncbi:MAG: MerR family transcriptional regulator [Bryobacteraceae bacterium]|jgi:DNA-binding transcriptional MerR regulator
MAEIGGVSLRQLQWWDEQKVVSPRQHGHRRVYLPADGVEIIVIAELRRKRLSLPQIRPVLRFLRREIAKRPAEVIQSSSQLYLVTVGKSIYLERQPERILEILKGAHQASFLVCVSDQVRRLADVERKPVRRETGIHARDTRIG